MIAIILLILKIVGIILLSLVGLVITIVLAILFIPMRYEYKGSYFGKVDGKLKVSWLLHLITLHAHTTDKIFYYVKILGIKVYDSVQTPIKQEKKEQKKLEKEKKKELRKLKKKRKEKELDNELIKDDNNKVEENGAEENLTDETNAFKSNSDAPSDSHDESINIKDDPSATDKSISDQKKDSNKRKEKFNLKKFLKKIKNIYDKIKQNLKNSRLIMKNFNLKIKNFSDNIQYYLEVWEREETQEAIFLCKGQLLYLAKKLNPKKVRIMLHVGTTDPAVTGQILVIYSLLYPFFREKVVLEPEFDEAVLEVEAYVKGTVTVFHLINVFRKIYFDKNMKKFLSLLKKEVV